jgi:hypothetical protein
MVDPADPAEHGGKPLTAARTAIGKFFLSMAGVHVGLVAADPGIYEPFADQALSAWVRDRWVDVFMADPATWGLAVATGELALGVLLLLGGRRARAGYVGVIGFHLALMLFGWGFWVWSVPALALLLPLARSEFRHGELAAQAATPTRSPQPPGNQIVLWLLRRGLGPGRQRTVRSSSKRSADRSSRRVPGAVRSELP